MRSPSIDVLRIVTVVLIVWRHTFGASDLMIASVGVPFFFFLTGWLWRPGRRQVKQEALHRWKTLGIPYLSWLGLGMVGYLTLAWIQGTITVHHLMNPLLGGSYAKAPFSTFWFITALFGVSVVMRLLECLPAPLLVTLGMTLLGLGSKWGEPLAMVPWSVALVLPCLGFVLLGHVLYRVSQQQQSARVTAVILLPVVVIVTRWCEPLRLKQGDFGTPLASALCAVVITWGAIVVLDWLSGRAPAWCGRLSVWLGPVTSVAIVVVLTHPFMLWIFRLVRSEPIGTIGLFLTASIVPWVVGLGLKRSWLAPWLIGESRMIGSPRLTSLASRIS